MSSNIKGFIAMHGVDGVGKSTILEAVVGRLRKENGLICEVNHLRPTLLPPLGKLKGRSINVTGPTLDPHGSKPSGFFGSIIRLIYLCLDYILGYWLIVRPKIKHRELFFFDRYAYDMFLDQRRFRISLPNWVIRIGLKFLPQPELSVCLYAPVDVIYSRKQELPPEELERQSSLLKAYAASNPRAVLINTDQTVDEVCQQVYYLICDQLG